MSEGDRCEVSCAEATPSSVLSGSPDRETRVVDSFQQNLGRIKDFDSLDDVVEQLASTSRLPHNRNLDLTDLIRVQREFETELSEDISPTLARWFSEKLFRWITSNCAWRAYADLYRGIAIAYSEIVRVQTRLWVGFLSKCLRECKERSVESLDIISRDAVPLYMVAAVLQGQGYWDGGIRLVELNREMFGIPHVGEEPEYGSSVRELPFGPRPEELRRTATLSYLKHLYGDGISRATVESGYYGTLVLRTRQLGFLEGAPVFFMSSANPNIFGYANLVISAANLNKGKIPQGFAEFLGDAIESIPKIHRASRLVSNDGIPLAISTPVSPSFEVAANAAYWSTAHFTKTIDPSEVNPLDEVVQLYELWLRVRRDATDLPYLLPERMAPWRDRSAFLRSEFRLGPLPPMDAVYLQP
jgi:hypothetical protein